MDARAASAHAEDVFAFGDAPFYGSTGALALTNPIAGMAASPSGRGYWLVASDGGVFSFGDARFYGSTGALRLNRPIVGLSASPSGQGYWFVASDGGVFSFGDARFFGSTGALRLNRPIVGMKASPSGRGYWLVASDGGIFSFGDARFFGSTGGLRLNRPIVGMAATPSGRGYRFVSSDGGIFSFGDAYYHGSLGATARAQPIVSMSATTTGNGYWLAAADGAVYGFGDAVALKPLAATAFPASQRVIGIAADPADRGFWLTSSSNPKAEAAIAWYMSRMGQAVYTGQCELAVENAYGTSSVYATGVRRLVRAAGEASRLAERAARCPRLLRHELLRAHGHQPRRRDRRLDERERSNRHRGDRLLPEPARLDRLVLLVSAVRRVGHPELGYADLRYRRAVTTISRWP
jgi:ribosomal protein L24E